MKKYLSISIVLLMLLSINSFGQRKGILIYTLSKVDSINKLASNIQRYKLYFNNDKSIQFPIPSNQKIMPEKVTVSEHVSQERFVIYAKDKSSFLLKNFATNIILNTEFVEFKKYYLTDTLERLKWTITSNYRKIANYNCTKAITKFRGRVYEVWYTEDVPINVGPWKFDGLPGNDC